MKRIINKWYSPNLNKEMEIVGYGYFGRPLLLFPTAAADYLEYERFLLIDAIRPAIEAGQIKVYSINSINSESWLNKRVHPKYKAIRQQQYNAYIANEVIPYIWNDCGGKVGVLGVGASLGAFHCANQLFRRPDLFAGCIAMSGCYDITKYYDAHGYHDDNIYFNNVIEYLPNLNDNYYLPMLRSKSNIYIMTGQGDYESPDASRLLSKILCAKGIPHHLDVWGYDMPHDWPTWRDMMRFMVQQRL